MHGFLPLYDVIYSQKEFATKCGIEVALAIKRATLFKTRHMRSNLVAEAGINRIGFMTLRDGLLPDRDHKAQAVPSHL